VLGLRDEVEHWHYKPAEYDAVKRPEVAKQYNKCVGGIDLLDQLLGLYRIFIRSNQSKRVKITVIFHT
jgi:hypothetical protein